MNPIPDLDTASAPLPIWALVACVVQAVLLGVSLTLVLL